MLVLLLELFWQNSNFQYLLKNYSGKNLLKLKIPRFIVGLSLTEQSKSMYSS